MSRSEEASVPWLRTQEDAGAEDRRRLAFLEPLVSRLRGGRLNVVLPNGRALISPAHPDGLQGTIAIERWRALRRLALGGDVGFAEAYIDGDWTSPDLVALLRLAARNVEPLRAAMRGAVFFRWADRLRHLLRANTRRGSRRNIAAHYDLGNDFYALWLDPTMQYSSALWTEDTPDLETAQALKLDRIVELLDLNGGESVLEIGCGWGALATHLAQTRDARVTAITLSPAQLDFARARTGVRDRDGSADFRLQDYRDVRGRFDRVVSVEMLEAVGEARWPHYFQTIARSLKAERPGRPADDHHRRGILPRLSPQSRFHPEACLSRRLPAIEVGARGANRAGGIANPRSAKFRTVLRADARRMAQALPFAMAGSCRARLRRPLPPTLGLLSRLLRGRLHGRDDRRHARVDRARLTASRRGATRITERPMLTRRSAFPLLAAFAAAPALQAFAAEFRPYDEAAAQKAIASGKPVVIHVYAPWCLQCHMQASILDKLKDDPAYGGATFFRVDYDHQKDVVAKLDCPRSTVIAYKGGKEVSRMSWGVTQDSVVNVLKAAM